MPLNSFVERTFCVVDAFNMTAADEITASYEINGVDVYTIEYSIKSTAVFDGCTISDEKYKSLV